MSDTALEGAFNTNNLFQKFLKNMKICFKGAESSVLQENTSKISLQHK